MHSTRKIKSCIAAVLCILSGGCVKESAVPSVPSSEAAVSAEAEETASSLISEDTQCDDKECVAYYLYTYDHLPSNYMTKEEARRYGWKGGALHLVVEGMCIGGDEYSNYEETLPVDDEYHECDIDTLHKEKRGAKRIVWSEDGDIWYTGDHYETWTLLYGDGD